MKIASILTSIDEVTEVTEQKIQKLNDLKKATMNELLTKGIDHSEFRDSELGRIPKNWNLFQLGQLGEMYGGLSGKKASDFGTGEPYITYSQVFNNDTSFNEHVRYVQVKQEEKQNKIEFGDVLFTMSSETPNEVGMASAFLEKGWNPYLNSFCCGFRFNSSNCISPKFSRYLFRSFLVREKISYFAQGSTRYNLSKENLKKVMIPVPTIEEQEKIAEILIHFDDTVELHNLRMLKLQSLKKGLMEDLLTGKVRVKVD